MGKSLYYAQTTLNLFLPLVSRMTDYYSLKKNITGVRVLNVHFMITYSSLPSLLFPPSHPSLPPSSSDNADNSTVTALTCSMQLEVLSTSSSGQLKIWDLRTNTDHPTNTIVL